MRYFGRSPIRFGVELEFYAPILDGDILVRRIKNAGIEDVILDINDSDQWVVSWDGSVLETRVIGTPRNSLRQQCENGMGFEVKTPILGMTVSCLREFKKVVGALSSIEGAAPTYTSGMHVHISADNQWELDWEEFTNRIERRYRRFVRPSRADYCGSTSWHWRGDEFASVNRHEGSPSHAEVRIFNGTLDWGKIMRRVRGVYEIFDETLKKPANASRRPLRNRVAALVAAG